MLQTKVLNVTCTNRDIDGYFLKGGGTVWKTVNMCVCELCCIVIRPEINRGLFTHMMYFIQSTPPRLEFVGSGLWVDLLELRRRQEIVSGNIW